MCDFSLEDSEAVVGLMFGLISLLVCVGIERPEERERDQGMAGGAVRTHTFID